MQTLTNKPVREKNLVRQQGVPGWLGLTVPIAFLATAASVIARVSRCASIEVP